MQTIQYSTVLSLLGCYSSTIRKRGRKREGDEQTWMVFADTSRKSCNVNNGCPGALLLLFTMMVSHSYVPESFGVGIIIRVPKDKSGDLGSLAN